MSIDFRPGKMDCKLALLLSPVYTLILSARSIDRDTALLARLINLELDRLLPKIIDYYKNNKKNDYPIEENAIIRAHEVFSEFLQSLIYFMPHNLKLEDSSIQEFTTQLISKLINHDHFLYVSLKNNKTTVWIDPQETVNVLLCLSRTSGQIENVKKLLQKCDDIFHGKNTKAFKDFISHADKDSFSSLNTASKAGHGAIVQLLLEYADKAYGGKDTVGFRAFISHADQDDFSSLNTASKEGHVEIVRLLLACAVEAYGGKDTDGFQAFISHTDRYDFSPLNTASKEGRVAIVRLLLACAVEAYGRENTAGFQVFISLINTDGFSPLNTASKAGHAEIVQSLLECADKAYGGQDTDGFQAFISHIDKNSFSPLNTASKAGHVEIVQLLLECAAKAYGGKDTAGFRTFISHVDKDSFSPLNTASKEGHVAIVQLLFQNAAEAYNNDQTGFTQFLNCQNKYGFTPLNAACYEGKNFSIQEKHNQVAKILLHAKADPSILNKCGFSAKQNASYEVKQIIARSAADRISRVHTDFFSKKEATVARRQRRHSGEEYPHDTFEAKRHRRM